MNELHQQHIDEKSEHVNETSSMKDYQSKPHIANVIEDKHSKKT